MAKQYQPATFAAGCFWGVEARFREQDGVVDAEVGYTDGHKLDPTYHEVCTDTTGHVEAVQLSFDPDRVSFDDLVELFFNLHNPTTLNRQGPDVGSQYRSAIFYHNDEQKQIAEKIIDQLNQQNRFADPIVTQIAPATTFYRAEEYHQRYFDKKGQKGSCYFS
ncbi:Peptide methionine sulfoxide reductase MsrA [Candidatus Terasakiella magnetica]|uniref:Peptide methionine sulfoxide reductase MsrA n=1 Tax=Candidatus Terasakiella magnetica TaxID=1867952 RepID=A0A1C3RJL2_9PROT|nr:peptide-methionine (S)-S-oxide reductase MsrA [Candidatus Terasakiella magnetica]SCA57441.1 Peptide methionine sulfoxide reductase MsrA [Candidatus Terasakiella magnetica]